MGLFDNFPYTNFHELNLDWILKVLKDIETTIDQFVSLNIIKYADPIQWDITRQYPKNTIVIDPISGTAYISVDNVPQGVALSNTDYWSVVFDLGRFITLASSNFADNYESVLTTTATMPTDEGHWVVWNSILYEALNDIHVGDRYVVDGNIKRRTVEYFYNRITAQITQEITDRINAITAVNTRIDNEENARIASDNAILSKIGDLSNLSTNVKDNIVNSINEVNLRVAGEISDRINAINAEHTAWTDAINTEHTAWTDAVAGANGRINDLANIITPLGSNVITVSKVGSDFNTINAAINSIRDVVAENNPYTILITTGVYEEELNLSGINGLSIVGLGNVILQYASTYPMSNLYITGKVSIYNLHLIQMGDAYNIHSDTQGTNSPVRLTAVNCIFQRVQMSAGTYQHNIGWGSCDVGGDEYNIYSCNFIGGTAIGGHLNPSTSATGVVAWRVENCAFAVERCALDWGDACKIITGTTTNQRIAATFNGNKGNKGIIIQIASGESYNFIPAGSFIELYYSGGNNIVALNGTRTTTYWNIDSFSQNGAVGMMFIPINNANLYDCVISYAHIVSSDADIITACSIYGVSPNGISIVVSDYATVGNNAVQVGIAVSPNIVSAI